jgi:molecular chaperone DnaK
MIQRGCESVGIDLGTTYSALAYIDSQRTPRIVPDSSGQSVTPSVIYFDDAGIIVGDLALQQAKVSADRVVQFIKVRMGDEWKFEFRGQTHTPESLSAIILKHLINEAEPQIGPISRAVITVPAYFTERRRKATQQAGEIAGLQVTGTLNEPMAATLAYGLFRTETEQNVVVYDLGGGTFDVTVVRISPNEIRELATCGNRQLGGRDWDDVIAAMIAEDFQAAYGFDPRDDVQAVQDLAIECERAKRNLSRVAKVAVRIQAGGQGHVTEITSAAFEERTADLLQTTRLTTEMALEDAGLTWRDISRIVPVGGSTLMPSVRRMLTRVSGMTLDVGVNPVMAVSLGAAIYAQIVESGQNVKTITLAHDEPEKTVPVLTPIESVQPPPLPNSTKPTRNRSWRTDEDASDDNNNDDNNNDNSISLDGDTVEPDYEDERYDEISIGMDQEVEPLSGPSPVVRFVTAHGVGVKTRRAAEWRNTVLIPRNTPVPARASKRFLTIAEGDRGTHVNIEITQGDTSEIEFAEILGQGRIEGFQVDEPPGRPVEVIMEFDALGRLHVRAIYENTGQQLKLSLDVSGCLQQEEVDRFRQELRGATILSVFDPDAALAGLDDDDDDDDDHFDSFETSSGGLLPND